MEKITKNLPKSWNKLGNLAFNIQEHRGTVGRFLEICGMLGKIKLM